MDLDLPPRGGSLEEHREALRSILGEAMAAGAGRAWPEATFAPLALAVFRYQARANRVYRAFVENRGIDPDRLDRWEEIPAVPARAFKELPFRRDGAERSEAVFRTSGTSGRGSARGEHHVRDLSLYRASLLATARHFLRPNLDAAPDGPDAPLRILALLPSRGEQPDSSLVFMIDALFEAWDDGKGGFFADGDWRLRTGELERAVAVARADGVPLLLAGTAFSLVHWLDGMHDAPHPLPPGSILLETGGFKGRSRSVARTDLYRELSEALQIPTARIVNEYGMTELLSQFYEPVLLEGGPDSPDDRHHLGPPWLRTRILDPETLAAVAPGELGILCHFDLANLDSLSVVLTEDLGVETPGGFRVLGRAPGAEPRGCSLAMDDLFAAGEGEG